MFKNSYTLEMLRSSLKVILLVVVMVPMAHAVGNNSGLIKSNNPTQSLMFENINYPAQSYFNALMGNSLEDRRYAEMYLLGVLDSTEGSIWCDYKTYKTITIDEMLFVEFKKLTRDDLNERASKVITNILRRKFPCRSKQ